MAILKISNIDIGLPELAYDLKNTPVKNKSNTPTMTIFYDNTWPAGKRDCVVYVPPASHDILTEDSSIVNHLVGKGVLVCVFSTSENIPNYLLVDKSKIDLAIHNRNAIFYFALSGLMSPNKLNSALQAYLKPDTRFVIIGTLSAGLEVLLYCSHDTNRVGIGSIAGIVSTSFSNYHLSTKTPLAELNFKIKELTGYLCGLTAPTVLMAGKSDVNYAHRKVVTAVKLATLNSNVSVEIIDDEGRGVGWPYDTKTGGQAKLLDRALEFLK